MIHLWPATEFRLAVGRSNNSPPLFVCGFGPTWCEGGIATTMPCSLCNSVEAMFAEITAMFGNTRLRGSSFVEQAQVCKGFPPPLMHR